MIQTRKRAVEITELQCPQCSEWAIPRAAVANGGKIRLRADCATCNCSFETIVDPT